MTIPSANLVEALRQCPMLLPPAQLDEIVRRLDKQFPTPKALARELVKRGWLTHFQVNQLLRGLGNELVLGSYIILERLGAGGMGQVYKARHATLGRIVALKVMRQDRAANRDAIRRFQREIQAVSQLSHRNVVVAYDSNVIDGIHYFAMEFVDGTDLSKLVNKSGPLMIDKACEYIYQAALGLQHAHERGLVHRDIKPANLLLCSLGPEGDIIKILDMGLARLSEAYEDVTITQDGKVVGTPDYIAPEQARNAHKADIRADLYSLGCTFFFLLTGQVPFGGNTVLEKLMQHQLEKPKQVEKLRPEVPPAIRSILARLITRNPKDRFQTPTELAAALEAYLRSPVVKRDTRIDAKTIAQTDAWLFAHHGKARGPVTTAQLRQLAAVGRLSPNDRVWPQGIDVTRAVEAQAVVGPDAFLLAATTLHVDTTTPSTEGALPKWLSDVQQAEQNRSPAKKSQAKSTPNWLEDVRRSEGK